MPLARTTPYKLAEKIAAAWHASNISEAIAVPLGVTATLALLGQQDLHEGRDVAQHVLGLDAAALYGFLRRLWAHAWLYDPYLVSCCRPLAAWLDAEEPADELLRAIHAVARSAVTGGLLGLTGHPDPVERCHYDALGALLTVLRSPGDRHALAEHHSPPDLTALLVQLALLETPAAGRSFDDCAAGTGGMIRAAALMLRLSGADPADYRWSMGDLDPLAAACCAVNAMIWGLGSHVLIFCGDTLASGNGPALAARRRREVLDRFEHLAYAVAGLQAVIEAGQIITRAARRDAA
ncbi:DNA methyltransferase family protein [Nonomuraea wenchangensis]|uniref:N-6 DNA Methylase n=1 Tax=Nonomuraea wenchangensis TaxID=568860 RepID=A0A1I0LWG7_9ACTN|nr:hypothetical protein [Nonomuraea wenchangensis]SEU47829.1 hypothetical protein SAMN05421811_13215 [Nonomuraea wenchangensis]